MPPKQTQPFEMNRFSRGLITEASPLNFPADASVEEFNFTLDKDGTRRRRLGMNYEDNYVLNSTAYTRSDRYKLAISSFLWTNVGEDVSKEYVVLQIGSYLYFHDRSNEVLSTAPAATVTIGSAKTNVFSFASIDGDLIVANGTGNITRIEYDSGNFTKSTYRIRVRDQWGVEDIVDGKDLDSPTWINFRPEETTGAHNYNLWNQGWGLPRLVKEFDQQLLDPLDKSVTQFDYNKYPSNADIMHEWVRPDPEGSEQRTKFFSRDYQKEPPFTTPAAKGYFVIDLLLRGIDREGEFASNRVKHPELVTGLEGENLPTDETPGGCSVVSEYAGRVFYAGFEGEVVDGDEKSPRLSNYVAYSQLVDSPSQLGSCFQSGDPTSPDESDLLATDGGIIRISGAENIVDLKQVGRSLFVIATNGMWRISGGADEGFAADNFEVEKITEHGPVSRTSLVEVDNTFMFWADNGIYHVAPNQVGSWTATNVSNATIQEFYDGIAPENKGICQGVFDRYERQVRWLYPIGLDEYDQEIMEELILDLELQAFTPFRINNQAGGGKPTVQKYAVARPFTREVINQEVVTSDTVIVGANDVVIGEETISGFENIPTIKYLTIQFAGSSGTDAMSYTFSEYNEESWKDWGTEDAAAYMVTGSFIGGDSSRHKQVPYMTFHMEKEQGCVSGPLPEPCGEYECTSLEGYFADNGFDGYVLLKTSTDVSDPENPFNIQGDPKVQGYWDEYAQWNGSPFLQSFEWEEPRLEPPLIDLGELPVLCDGTITHAAMATGDTGFGSAWTKPDLSTGWQYTQGNNIAMFAISPLDGQSEWWSGALSQGAIAINFDAQIFNYTTSGGSGSKAMTPRMIVDIENNNNGTINIVLAGGRDQETFDGPDGGEVELRFENVQTGGKATVITIERRHDSVDVVTQNVPNDVGTSPTYALRTEYTWVVSVDGVKKSLTAIEYDGAPNNSNEGTYTSIDYLGPETPSGNGWAPQYYWQNNQFYVYALAFAGGGGVGYGTTYDEHHEGLWQAWQENFSNYTPPPYCADSGWDPAGEPLCETYDCAALETTYTDLGLEYETFWDVGEDPPYPLASAADGTRYTDRWHFWGQRNGTPFLGPATWGFPLMSALPAELQGQEPTFCEGTLDRCLAWQGDTGFGSYVTKGDSSVPRDFTLGEQFVHMVFAPYDGISDFWTGRVFNHFNAILWEADNWNSTNVTYGFTPEVEVTFVSQGGGLFTLQVDIGNVDPNTGGLTTYTVEDIDLSRKFNSFSLSITGHNGEVRPNNVLDINGNPSFHIASTNTIKVNLNGHEIEATHTELRGFEDQEGQASGYTDIRNIRRNESSPGDGIPYFFRDMKVRLLHMAFGGESGGTVGDFHDETWAAFQRSFDYYEVPGYCDYIPCAELAASCLVTSSWDHATGADTNRLSRQFQVYREVRHQDKSGYTVVTTRNRVPGRGRSYFMRMDTEPSRACSILGWNLSIDGNAHV